MDTVLLNNHGFGNEDWHQLLSDLLPQMNIEVYPHISDKNAVRYAVVWRHPMGDLQTYPKSD